MNKELDYLLIKKILFSKTSKSKLIRSAILIILVVALLIVSSIFINSMSLGIEKKFALLVNGDIEVYTTENLIDKYDFIKTEDLVASTNALVYGKDDTQVTQIKAVYPSYFNQERIKSLKLKTSDIKSNLPSIYISKILANKLNIKLGDKAALIIANDETKIRPKLVFIKGIFDSGYKEIDLNLCFMDINELSNIVKEQLYVNKEIILYDNISIRDALTTLNIDGYNSRAWYEIQPSVYNNLLVSTQSLMIVFIVIALLTGYFISSISSEIITKDHQTIAVNKLLGLRNKVIRKNYFIAIEIFTVISTVLGVLLGIIISKTFLIFLRKLSLENIPALSWYLFDFDIIIPYKNIIIIAISLILISFFSVYLSLRRIKKIEVLDLINHE